MTGEYKDTGADALYTKVELTERRTGKTIEIIENTTIKRAYQELIPLFNKIKSKFLLKEPASLSIDTENESEAFVFLDGEYLGKTPMERSDIFPGKHSLSISKPGFQRIEKIISPEPSKMSKYSFPLKKIETSGTISVITEPSGAAVYLGNQYLGDSPIESIPVKEGMNRIRIIKEEYIDHFQGVEVKKDNPIKLKVNLKQGNTETYYKNRLNVFLDYNYFDFALYSIYGSIAFYATYAYSGYRIDVERSKLDGRNGRNFVSTISFYQSLATAMESSAGGLGFVETTVLQQYLINKTESDLRKYHEAQSISLIGMGSMVALSGIFYYFGISSDAFEFGMRPGTPGSGDKLQADWRLNFYF
jgi:hypothetical protein